jgi:hypothetical protein
MGDSSPTPTVQGILTGGVADLAKAGSGGADAAAAGGSSLTQLGGATPTDPLGSQAENDKRKKDSEQQMAAYPIYGGQPIKY